MNGIFRQLLTAIAILLPAFSSQAAITCNISSSGFATAYNPGSATANITQTSFTVTCTRGASGDPTSVSYTVAANNGLNSVGINNRAAFGGSYIRYDDYKDGACGTQWKGSNTFADTITFSGTGIVSKTTAYWGCVTASQTGLPAGTYTDSVTITLSYGPNPQSTATNIFSVSISTPAVCNVTAAPGNIVFNYTAFTASAVTASTTFGATCTNALPYTMALDATSGTMLGLNYTLALGAASSVGTGSQQTISITGTMAAGQSGTCTVGTCTATQARTLTITY